MENVYVALMDNGSGDEIIHGIHATREGALAQLQREFFDFNSDDDDDDDEHAEFADKDNPTLEEMQNHLPGTGCNIIEVKLGSDIYVEISGGWE